MSQDPIVQRVLEAVQGKPDAIRRLSDALVSRDPARLREAVSSTAEVPLTDADAQALLASMPADDQQALAYFT